MRRMIAISLSCILALVAVSFVLLYRYREKADRLLMMTEELTTSQQTIHETESPEGMTKPGKRPVAESEPDSESESQAPQTEDPALHAEDGIYTFLQGPVAWESKAPWSGIWCESELDGGLFSVFGCGLCDLAGVYSSLTPYECSPLDMYALARKVSDYAPGDGAGAIDWPYMVETLERTGIFATLKNKDRSYKAFQKAIADCPGAIVLISSEDDDTYWQDTPGHYVNIWHYHPETDQVFLGDSGNPKHNREWIPLRYIYDALAADSAWQYLLIHSYEEEKNTWKYSGIHEKWTRPAYYRAKPESRSLLMPAPETE